MKILTKQFVKFCLIGIGNSIVNYSVFFILLFFIGINYLISSGTGYISGTFLGYFLNRKYTFHSREEHKKTIPLYYLVYFFSLVFTIFSMKFLVDYIGISPYVSKVGVIGMTTLINFIGTKLVAFKNFEW